MHFRELFLAMVIFWKDIHSVLFEKHKNIIGTFKIPNRYVFWQHQCKKNCYSSVTQSAGILLDDDKPSQAEPDLISQVGGKHFGKED